MLALARPIINKYCCRLFRASSGSSTSVASSSLTSSLVSNASGSLLVGTTVRKPSTRCAVVRPMLDVKREVVVDDVGNANIRQLMPNLDLTAA
uniref:Uncharacterized protein n=1 Tax=Parascaris equorum TaxID=6256 RepID=A0A914RJN3_PAREQ